MKKDMKIQKHTHTFIFLVYKQICLPLVKGYTEINSSENSFIEISTSSNGCSKLSTNYFLVIAIHESLLRRNPTDWGFAEIEIGMKSK